MPDLVTLTLGIALVFASGVATGWQLARRSTRYMLGSAYDGTFLRSPSPRAA
jgi:hypothetical protein